MSLLLRRWEGLSERLMREVQLENVWVNLRTANRGRDTPDQTPGSADRGSRTPGQHDLLFLLLYTKNLLNLYLSRKYFKIYSNMVYAGEKKVKRGKRPEKCTFYGAFLCSYSGLGLLPSKEYALVCGCNNKQRTIEKQSRKQVLQVKNKYKIEIK